MPTREVQIPDLGDVEGVTVVEVLVAKGDRVEKDDGLVTLESDKASMDVPSPEAGTVEEIRVEEGSEVEEGDVIVVLEVEEAGDQGSPEEEGGTSEREEEGGTSAPSGTSERGTSEREEEGGTSAPSAEEGGGTSSEASGEPVERDNGTSSDEPRRQSGTSRQQEGGTSRSDSSTPDLPEADLTCQVLVLGSGPGGYTAAFRAADLGQRVVLVERYSTLGGVCLNVGCIPSKALLHVARVIEEAADLADHGVDFGDPVLDLDKLRGFKDGVVSRLTKGLATMADKRRVEIVRGTGRFSGPHLMTVDAEEGEVTVAFEKAIVAAGSRVVEIPGIPWDDPRVMSSTGALELAEVPERLLLVGGGIIGLEMAMVYGSLGSELTIVEMLDGLIPGCDRDLVKPLERRLKRRLGAKILLGTEVASIEADDDGLHATFEGDEAADEPQLFDRALVAVGRRPNGDVIGAEAAGIEVEKRGFVPVDKQQRTSVPHIFAIGDITGEPMLAHKASHQGKVAAEVAAGEKSAFDARVVPSVAYTDPEIAWVGLTETEAAERGTAYELASFPWSASGRSLGMGRSDGLTRILFDPETHRVLGAGIVGPNAGDLISELTLAIEMGCEAGDLALTIHPHPTLSETIAFAAEAYEGTITDLYLPKKS